jgi:metal-responsive CopG/Arc/MetJ family transcriptional regulator
MALPESAHGRHLMKTERIVILFPPVVVDAIDRVAAGRLQTRSELVRQTLVAELRRAGELEQVAS